MKILGLDTGFERGILAGAFLFAAIVTPFIASSYPEIVTYNKWVITGICGFAFLVLLFIHSWIEAKKATKSGGHSDDITTGTKG